MTITVDQLTISNNVSAGTVIGVLTAHDAAGNIIPCNYTLTKGATGYFTVSNNQLVAAWSMPIAPGYYSVRVHAIGTGTRFSGSATLTVTVVMSAPPPPPPPPPAPSIKVNGSNNPVVTEGAALSVAVANGPGNPTDWVGLAAADTPDTAYIAWAYLSGSHMVPNVGITSATVMMTAPSIDASYEARFYLNDGFMVLARTTFTVQGIAPPAPPPPSKGAR